MNRVLISAINWGEVVGKIHRNHGAEAAAQLPMRFLPLGLEVVPVTLDQAARAAILKADLNIPYADAFCVELALNFSKSVLITGDYDFKLAKSIVNIRFLPNRI